MLTTTTHRRRTASLCGAALLLAAATACGEGHSSQRLGEMIAETVRDSSGARMPALGLPDTAFVPSRYACAPRAGSEVPGGWRSQAPRASVEGSVRVGLGLHGSEGNRSRSVVASVTGPGGETASAEAEVFDGGWVHLSYPDDFGSGELATGVHTVVWSEAGSGALLTCDGFEVG